jgi:hypothetical protein
VPPAVEVRPMSAPLQRQLTLSLQSARNQWSLKPEGSFEERLSQLERVTLFLKRNGSPSRQATQVSSLAFCFGELLVDARNFQWCCAVLDHTETPAVHDESKTLVWSVIDIVTVLLVETHSRPLGRLLIEQAHAQVPNTPGVFLVR